MRFGLLALFAAVTLSAVCLAMVSSHGSWGVVLSLPHILAASAVTMLSRWRRWLAASLFGAGYVACWGTTGFLGGPSVVDHIESKILRLNRHAPWKRVDHDPVMNDTDSWPPRLEHPWYFVGNPTSPCPFVAAVDYDFNMGPMRGRGGKAYAVWFFGYRQILFERIQWSS